MSRILRIRSKRVSEVGGEESAHLPPKRDSYVMRVCAIVGRSWLREFPTTGFGHVARWGSRRRPRTVIGYAVISRRRVLKWATENRYSRGEQGHEQALIELNLNWQDQKPYNLLKIWNSCAQEYFQPHDIPVIFKLWNQQNCTTTLHHSRLNFSDPETSKRLYI